MVRKEDSNRLPKNLILWQLLEVVWLCTLNCTHISSSGARHHSFPLRRKSYKQPNRCFRNGHVRTALDLSGHYVRDVGVAGSNPVTPTIDLIRYFRRW